MQRPKELQVLSLVWVKTPLSRLILPLAQIPIAGRGDEDRHGLQDSAR